MQKHFTNVSFWLKPETLKKYQKSFGLPKSLVVLPQMKLMSRLRLILPAGMLLDKESPKPAKTTFEFMVKFLYDNPALVVRFLLVTKLESALLQEQLIILIETILDTRVVMYLEMTIIFQLTHEVPVLPSHRNQSTASHRNQSIDLLCKSIDWFRYEGDTGIWCVNQTFRLFQ